MRADPAHVAGDLLIDALADRIAERVLARLPQPVERQAYTLSEAAESLGLSRATIERLVAAGHLTAQHAGTRRIVTPQEIRRFAKEGGEL